MHCPNCDQAVAVPAHEDLRFVVRDETASYLIIAENATGTRLVHECGLRGVRDPR